MASAQSSALRSAPGYAPRVSTTTPAVTFPVIPTLPTVPDASDSRAPNYLQRQLLQSQLGAIPGQQATTLTGIQATAKQNIAGYGGYAWGVDDPNTPQNEGLQLNYDASKGLGEKEKGAYRGAQNEAAARGMGESSFANQNISSAVQRMTLEGQQVANQYAANLNQIYQGYAGQVASITSQLAGLYGADSQWLVDNPPPKPADIMSPYGSNLNGPGAEGDVWAGYHDPDPAGLAYMYPGMDFSYRTDPDGRVVVTARRQAQAAPQPQAPGAAGAPPGPSTWTPNASGNIVTNIRFSDLTPHSASLLAMQYPGYKLVRSGSGVAVLKKV